MRIAAIALAITLSTPTAAQEIGALASNCWNLGPLAKSKVPLSVTFDVTLDPAGHVTDVDVVNFKPNNRTMVRSASRAIQMCGPYPSHGTAARVTMRWDAVESDLIDPFKD